MNGFERARRIREDATRIGVSGRRLSTRTRQITLCLSAALLSPIAAHPTSAVSPMVPPHYLRAGHVGSMAGQTPSHPDTPQTWVVQNCDDHGDGSLRDIIENPTKAKSGDFVDLSMLPTQCGATDSRITLTSGQITIAQDDLTLQGPDAVDGTLTISGGNVSRVFDHHGAGTLALTALTVASGYYEAAGDVFGGCLNSLGSLYLDKTVVTGCTASSDAGYAFGGGIYVANGVTLVSSTVSGNKAIAPSGRGVGGGIGAASLTASYSSISGNVAGDGVVGGFGGGAYVQASVSMFASTVDHNTASHASAFFFRHGSVSNSTISGNVAHVAGAVEAAGGNSVVISNSTIAFNHEAFVEGAVFFNGASASSTLELQSSIIADNTAGAANTPSDVWIASGHGVLVGASNLVIATNVTPPVGVVTVTSDPMLGQLQFNGGPTMTHALLLGSPAVNAGNNNNASLTGTDQRGIGFPRTSGPAASVDIGAVQFDTIFLGSFD